MNLDAACIAYATRIKGGFNELKRMGVSEVMLEDDYSDAWKFIIRCVEKHGKIPSPDFLSQRFDWGDIPIIKRRDGEALVERLIKRKRYKTVLQGTERVLRSLNDFENIDDAVIELQKVLVGSNGVHTNGHVHDPFTKSAVLELVEEVEDIASGNSIPTPWPTINKAIGGLRKGKLIIIAGRPTEGKAQPLDAKVLTPSGWTTMGAIRVGDLVSTPDGNTARVIQVHPQGVQPIYQVLLSDGSQTRTTKDHLWITRHRNERILKSKGRLRTTEEISKTLTRDNGKRLNHQIPLVNEIDIIQEPIDLDPYLLGALLGDGHLKGKSVGILLTADDEVTEQVRSVIPDDCHLVSRGGQRGKAFQWRISKKSKSAIYNSVGVALTRLGLIGLGSQEKFVPHAYKFGSYKTRLAVLQGLFDTDGTVDNWHRISFCSVSPQLAEDVRWLVQSLGGTAYTHTKNPFYYSSNREKIYCKTAYILSIQLPEGVTPFRVQRKVSRMWDRPTLRQPSRFIKSVEYVGNAEAQCITLDNEDGLYITDDCIVTHNSFGATHIIASAISAKHKVLFYSLEMTQNEVFGRLYTILSHKDLPPEDAIRNLDFAHGRVKRHRIISVAKSLAGKYRGRLMLSTHDVLCTLDQIEADIENYHPDMVWVDYLTLMPRRRANDDRVAIAELSTGLKRIALKQQVVIGACAQLNREAVSRPQKKPGFERKQPQLEHIFGSDGAAQDANIVLLLQKHDDGLSMFLAKNRGGPQYPDVPEIFMDFRPDEGVMREYKD